jgi:glutamyl/glutaminyl-tRNA synthetase
MVNFLAMLGWSPGGDQELFTRGELIGAFTLEGISGGNAVFNPEKLDWVNQQHIQRLTTDDLASRLAPLLRVEQLWSDDLLDARREWFSRVIELFKPRIRKLDQFGHEARPLLAADVTYEPDAVAKHIKPEVLPALEALGAAFGVLASFTAEPLETALRRVAETRQIKAAALIHATRVAVTGRTVSPGLFDMLELAGRERVLERLGRAPALASSWS